MDFNTVMTFAEVVEVSFVFPQIVKSNQLLGGTLSCSTQINQMLLSPTSSLGVETLSMALLIEFLIFGMRFL